MYSLKFQRLQGLQSMVWGLQAFGILGLRVRDVEHVVFARFKIPGHQIEKGQP